MIEFLTLGIGALGIALWALNRHWRDRFEEQDERIASLTARVWSLERTLEQTPAPRPATELAPTPETPYIGAPFVQTPTDLAPPPPPPPPPLPLPPSDLPLPAFSLPAQLPPPPTFAPAEPQPSWRDRFQGQEWEAILGGSILNKIGALILVIAIALLLKLSLEQLGAAGKIAVGALTGASILGLGLWVERKPKWKIFSVGLLAAGWAILYFTAFAAHGIPESRVIASPTVGLLVMLAVAAAMIARSLRYESQWVTGLTFFLAFVALQIDRGSLYALAASAILAGGLLLISFRFNWQILALSGIGLAYFTVAFVPQPPLFLKGIGQPILWVYWLLFETFDLALDRRENTKSSRLRPIHFLLNSFAFVGASLLATPPKTEAEHFSAFLGLATMGFAASFLLRFRQNPEAMAEHPVLGGLSLPGLSLTATTALAFFAILQRFDRLMATLAFLILGEVLFLFAWRIDQAYPRYLALGVQIFAFLKLSVGDTGQNGKIPWMGLKIAAVSPMLALLSGVNYFNRTVARGRFVAPVYTWMASIAVYLLIGHEVPDRYCLAAWAVLALVLLEAGLRLGWSEFRYQSYATNLITAALAAAMLAFGTEKIPWISWLIASFALAWQTWRIRTSEVTERRFVEPALPVLGTLSLTCLGWAAAPSTLVAPFWGLIALALLELSLALEFPALRWCAVALSSLAFGRLFLSNFAISGRTGLLSHRVLTVTPFLAYFYYFWTRTRFRLSLWAPPILALFLVRFEIGRVYSAVGVMFAALVLLWFGFRRGIVDLRWQAYLGAAYAFFRAWATNFFVPGSFGGVPVRVLSASLIIAAFFAAQRLIARQVESRIDRWARLAFPVLGATLLAALLYNEVSGRVLTAAWSAESALLLIAGFILGERVMRLSGLALFLFCILKLFIYDLSSLEGIPRILSFIVLGVLLMGASWLYTRFREQLNKHL